MSAYIKPDMATEAMLTAHIRENDELKKQIATAVAEWKKWEQKAVDNWCSYVERIAKLEAELEAERQRRWDGNEANSRELAECQAREAKLREALKR
jgi:hypothetical protein